MEMEDDLLRLRETRKSMEQTFAENSKCLVIATIYMDEDDFYEIETYENVTGLKQVFDIEDDEEYLEFTYNGATTVFPCSEIEWYRYVPSNSPLANYARQEERYDCEWDDDGNECVNIEEFIEVVKEFSPRVFINGNNELILVPKINIYLRLEDVYTKQQLISKIFSWLTRHAHTGVREYWGLRIRKIINKYLGTNFSKKEFELIYSELGNDQNPELCARFIESNYDLTLLGSVY